MKQKLYILGIITLLLIVASTLLKINHLAGASILMTTGMSLLVLILLPLALYNNYLTESNARNGLLYLITWITCMVVFGGMLFKVMHWPGAGRLLMLALLFPFVVFLPIYLYATSRIKNYNLYNIVFVLFLLVFMSVFSLLLGLNVSTTKIDQSLLLADNYRNITGIIQDNRNVTSKAESNDNADRIQQTSDNLLSRVKQCRELLYAGIQTTAEQLQINGGSSTWMIDSRSITARTMLPDEENSPAALLESDIRKFVQAVQETPGCDSLGALTAGVLLIYDQDLSGKSWQTMMFGSNYVSWALIYLDSVETTVWLVKKEVLLHT